MSEPNVIVMGQATCCGQMKGLVFASPSACTLIITGRNR